MTQVPLLYVLRTQMETAEIERYWKCPFISQIRAHNPRSSHQQLTHLISIKQC